MSEKEEKKIEVEGQIDALFEMAKTFFKGLLTGDDEKIEQGKKEATKLKSIGKKATKDKLKEIIEIIFSDNEEESADKERKNK